MTAANRRAFVSLVIGVLVSGVPPLLLMNIPAVAENNFLQRVLVISAFPGIVVAVLTTHNVHAYPEWRVIAVNLIVYFALFWIDLRLWEAWKSKTRRPL